VIVNPLMMQILDRSLMTHHSVYTDIIPIILSKISASFDFRLILPKANPGIRFLYFARLSRRASGRFSYPLLTSPKKFALAWNGVTGTWHATDLCSGRSCYPKQGDLHPVY
jgi:hypothetical protein